MYEAKQNEKGYALAVGYTRVSTREQAESGLSLELQEKAIKGYCRQNKINLDSLISDPGESGKDLDRPGIRRLIDLCRERKAKHVIVYRLDRLTRRLIDLLTLQEDIFRKNGIELHSITEKIDTSTAIGKLYVSMIGAISEMERDLISERTRDALAQKKTRGEPMGRAPYGWDYNEQGWLVENEEEKKARRRIRRLKKEGKTNQEVADDLNYRNIRTKSQRKFTAGTITMYLRQWKSKKLRLGKPLEKRRFLNNAENVR